MFVVFLMDGQGFVILSSRDGLFDEFIVGEVGCMGGVGKFLFGKVVDVWGVQFVDICGKLQVVGMEVEFEGLCFFGYIGK